MALLLAACASYTPRALLLTGAESALDDPVAKVLESRASTIERPFLAPVDVDLSKPLTGDAIAAIAVVNSPDLIALRARAGISEAQSFAAGLLPDPSFSAGASTVISGPDTLLDLSGALGFDLNALRTRAVRREQAVAQQGQVRLDLAWAEWQVSGAARIQAVRIQSLQAMVDLARASQETAGSQLARISQAVGRGDIAGDRLQSARIASAIAQDQLRTLEQEFGAAKVELTRLLGLPPSFALDLAKGQLPPTPPAGERLFELASTNRTDLAALRQGYAAQEAAVHQAVLEQFPNLGLSLNGQRDSGGNFLAGPAIDFTLPLWNRNRGGIAIERATREALRAEFDARLFQTRADIAAAESGIALAADQRQAALGDLPSLQRFASATTQAANRGDLSREAAENAEQAVRDRRLQLLRAELDYAEQMIALELLTGTPREVWPQ